MNTQNIFSSHRLKKRRADFFEKEKNIFLEGIVCFSMLFSEDATRLTVTF